MAFDPASAPFDRVWPGPVAWKRRFDLNLVVDRFDLRHTRIPRLVIQWKGHPPATGADTQAGPATATAEASRSHQRADTGRRKPSSEHA